MADDGGEPDEFLYKVLVVGEVRVRLGGGMGSEGWWGDGSG